MARQREEAQRLAAIERECLQKDQLIEQLYRERETFYPNGSGMRPQQRANGIANDITQRLAQLEQEVVLKRAEVEQLRDRVNAVNTFYPNLLLIINDNKNIKHNLIF